MAKVVDNLITIGLSGKLGKHIVFRTMKDGRTIMCKRPDFSNRVLSEKQRAHHRRVQEAAAYAQGASKKNPIYAELARGTAKNAYNVALSDWFHPPVIHHVARQDGRIRVKVSDNVLVTKVLISVSDKQGGILEQGQAVQVENAWWEYRTLTAGSVNVEAFDLAGNVTSCSSK